MTSLIQNNSRSDAKNENAGPWVQGPALVTWCFNQAEAQEALGASSPLAKKL
jgi:hypothetical protein